MCPALPARPSLTSSVLIFFHAPTRTPPQQPTTLLLIISMASPPAGHVLREANITLDHVLKENNEIRKTKIVCTLGPACWSVEGLGALIDAGMLLGKEEEEGKCGV